MQKRSVPYVETVAGVPAFFLCLLIAAVLGTAFRLYFSPQRVSDWVRTAIERQKHSMAHPFALSFEGAALRLSDGNWWPELSVVVSDVRIAPNPECRPEASVLIGELRLPFRVLVLIQARAAVGVIAARDVTVDLDGLRARCEKAPIVDHPNSVAETAQALSAPKEASDSTLAWWTPEQFTTVGSFVQGIAFSHANVQFENKTKEIDLDSFRATLERNGSVHVQAEIRIPPAVSFGETVPPLKVEGSAVSTRADLTITARVSEGSVQTAATLTPAPHQRLQLAARASVKSLPLSQVSPLMRKAGLVDERFQPKFLWIECAAAIEGPFQGLFQTSPLKFEACRIEGDGTDLQLASAERFPDGSWKPFDVEVRSLDLAKLFATAGVQGPEGVASNFGKLEGEIHLAAPDDAHFKGHLRNAQLTFSNRNVRADQKIETASVDVSFAKGRIEALFNNVQLMNGQWTGGARAKLERGFTTGDARVEIETLRFDPAVQRVLTGGSLGDLSGFASLKVERARITDMSVKLSVGETKGEFFDAPSFKIITERRGEEPPVITVDAPFLDLKTSALSPALLGHELKTLEKPHLRLTVLGDGDLEWSQSHATLERGRVTFTSNGTMNRDHAINGLLSVDFPKIKNVRFTMEGPLTKPVIKGAGDAYDSLKKRVEIDDEVLGL